jgi:RHS repeat-associated protein
LASRAVAGVTTTYLVDTQNPTGYAQIVYESSSGAGVYDTRSYVYGLDRISQNHYASGFTHAQISYYVYDGHGSVRALTDTSGNVTDTYDYDAFGNLISSTFAGIPPGGTSAAPTANEFLFAGEQYDSDLHLYYNRARYLNVSTGRFWSMDTYEGDDQDPPSLHKYLYAEGDPVDGMDPSGNQDDVAAAGSDAIENMASLNLAAVVAGVKNTIRDDPRDLWLVPEADHQRYGVKAGWSSARPPERSILYVLQRKDGKPLKNRDYNWTISEHQEVAALAGPCGTSSQDGGRFCDGITPFLWKTPFKSDQTFSISPQPGNFNPANENYNVIVHTNDGDFGTLRIWMDWHAVTINGFEKWTGTDDYECTY